MSPFNEERRDPAAEGPYAVPPSGGPPPQAYAVPPPGGPPPQAGAVPPPYVAGMQPGPGWKGSWNTVASSRRKSVGLAYFLSFLMPGLGQVYVGYYQRGFLHAIIFASLVAVLSSGSARGIEPLFGVFLAFFYLYNIVDAGRRAAFYNLAIDGMQPTDLPEDFKMPAGGGSLVGGLILTGIGLLLFLNLRFDINIDWIVEWWPLVLVAFGVHLVYKALRRKQA